MGSIYQSIELLSKEKGIETQIVLDAVKDALLVAARKHYRTNENYIAELNDKTGGIDLFAVKKVVGTVENPALEMTLAEAKRIDPAAEIDTEIRIQKSISAAGSMRFASASVISRAGFSTVPTTFFTANRSIPPVLSFSSAM